MKYVEQTQNPYQYYLKTLKNAIYSMANNNSDVADKFYKDELLAIEELNNDLPSVHIQPNHPTRLLRTAEYISEFIFRTALTIKSHNKVNITPCYAVEYYTYDFEKQFNSNKPYFRNEFGDYDKKMNKFWSLLSNQQSSINLLTKPNLSGTYNVINFDEISRSLQSIIKNYYSQHPNMLGNVSPDTNFQTEFGSLLATISSEIVKNKNHSSKFSF